VCVTTCHGCLWHNNLPLGLMLKYRLGLVSLLNLTLGLNLISFVIRLLLVHIHSMSVRAGIDSDSLSR
jgi:hypothetical protein